MQLIQTTFTLIISYSLAALLSSHIFMDISQTHWASGWTYFWWAMSFLLIYGLFSIIVIAGFKQIMNRFISEEF